MDDSSNPPELIERFGTQPPDVMAELQLMLRIYDIDAQELFFKWESYSMKMGPDDVKLTYDTVLAFKKDVQEQLEKELRGKAKMQQTPAVQRTVRPQAAGADPFALLDGMLPTTPARGSAVKRKNVAYETPRGKTSRKLDIPSSPAPALSSPMQTPHKPFSSGPPEAATPFNQRNAAGETIEVLNSHIHKPTLPLKDVSYDSRVKLLLRMEHKNFAYRPMYQKLMEASEVQDERIDEFATAIQEHYSLDDAVFGDPSIASPSEIVAVGRIVSDSLEGKFNPSSILLESSRMTGAGARTPLKLDKISSFAFFPGQIVAVKGVNSSGAYFQVHEVMDPPKLPSAATSTAELAAIAERLADGPMSIFMASGPYTTQDNFNFEALDELCTKAVEQQPDVVIFTGPFIDSEHPLVKAGEFDLEDTNMMNDGTIEDLFCEKISRKIQRIKNSMVIMIPSLRDAVSNHCSFPQEQLKRKHLGLPSNVKCLPNPIMFSINELVFAITTNDILFHMQREEITRKPTTTNPPARLSSHLLTQRSFYPLFPPPPRENLPPGLNTVGAALDVPHFRLADLVGVTPDVLVVPSLLGTFAKIEEGVVVVNPGSASKPRGAGTWVEIVVKAPEIKDGITEDQVRHDVWERVRVEVRRI
ncbi:DNA polymerase alpha subunit B N-terminal-domain-containing protein [Trichophaea hybrida]|nr:DNA polymerase alpha subunit B N-terminal-domain-containing protein [Trichophaea hybrida]